MSWHHAYADDEQIYASDKGPVKLEMKLQCQIDVKCKLFFENEKKN